MPTVCAGVLRRGRQVLIARRKPSLANGGCWEFPGGKLEAGEDPRRCLARELKEELGIEAVVGERLGRGRWHHAGEPLELLFYRAEWVAGDIRLRDHSEVAWVELRDLERYALTPADRRFARRLVEGLPGGA